MVVVVANDLPDAVRGRMKLWFVEPKPYVFVSGAKDTLAKHIVHYLMEHCPAESGVVIFRSLPHPPGYEIRRVGPTKKSMTEISGLHLVIEKMFEKNSE